VGRDRVGQLLGGGAVNRLIDVCRRCLRSERGSMLLLTVALLGLFLIMGGVAVDLAYLATASGELQRSVDAAALAGAGKLGFDSSVFPDVRLAAQGYAAQNPYRDLAQPTSYSNVTLDLNTSNSPDGDIVLGIWDPAKPAGIGSGLRFQPSLDGTRVNAVMCQSGSAIPPAFLRLIGITSLNAGVRAIAVSNPPNAFPPWLPLFPVGASPCLFYKDGSWDSSAGCGGQMNITFTPTPNNNGAWINIYGTAQPSASVTQANITAVFKDQASNTTLTVGSLVGTDNGQIQSAFDTLADYFVLKYNSPHGNPYTVKDSSGNVAYKGQGWPVYIPLVSTTCPPSSITSAVPIVGWTQFVITQIYDKNRGIQQGGAARGCMVINHYPGNIWDDDCKNGSPQQTSIYGFFNCVPIQSASITSPGPRTSLSTRMKLVN
jgi:hypothetical protein